MQFFENILGTIGNTPLIKLNTVAKEIPATVLGKVEFFNPGNSIKDRMALKMVEDAEKNGSLKPGGTIIECTSGNTGMGIAIAAAVKGYRTIFTTSDKQSKEKIDILRAMGAEVIVVPIVFGVIFGIFYLFISARNRERLALIEKGADASIFYSKNKRVTPFWKVFIINFALLLVGIGLGIFVGSALHYGMGVEEGVAYSGTIFTLAGIGLLTGFFLTKKLSNGDHA